jgi:prophage maintenance system killer protein
MPQLMQMQSMQQQNQLNQMTMQEKQRGQQEMNALRGVMSRPGFDLSTPESQRDVYNVAPTLAENFIKGHFGNLKTAAEVKNLGFTGQEVQAKAAAERAKLIGQAGRDINSRPDDENLISYDRDIQNSPLFTPEEKQAASNRTKQLLAMPMADRATYLSQQGATAGELRPQVVAPGASLMRGSTVVGTAPAAPDKAPTPTDLARLQNERAALLPGDPRIAQYDAAIRKATTSAPGVTVNVGNEKKYGEQFASKVAEGDVVLRAAAQEAPAAAENANRILQTLATGKAIVGAGADIKLGIAKLLNIAGADNAEIISNTEGMVTSMAQNTLNAIKTSGLGTGQGFTDKDLKFLEAAKSGNINFQPDTIRRLAELSHKAAEATADKWNSRAREIPASAIQGTGVSLEPVRVPKRASSVTEGVRPSGVGANWTLLVDANGSKAWVSPDRKQIKEVQ